MSDCTACKGKGCEADYDGLGMEPVAVDCGACGGSGKREDELRGLVAAAHNRHRYLLERETKAWMDELAQIELCKPPAPVVLPDGRIATYVGPLPVMENGHAKFKD